MTQVCGSPSSGKPEESAYSFLMEPTLPHLDFLGSTSSPSSQSRPSQPRSLGGCAVGSSRAWQDTAQLVAMKAGLFTHSPAAAHLGQSCSSSCGASPPVTSTAGALLSASSLLAARYQPLEPLTLCSLRIWHERAQPPSEVM